MHKHIAIAKAVASAACTLAIALSTIGIGVDFAWARSDKLSGLNYTPIGIKSVPAQPQAPQPVERYDLTENKLPDGVACSSSSQCFNGCCQIHSDRYFVCGASGRYTCKP